VGKVEPTIIRRVRGTKRLRKGRSGQGTGKPLKRSKRKKLAGNEPRGAIPTTVNRTGRERKIDTIRGGGVKAS